MIDHALADVVDVRRIRLDLAATERAAAIAELTTALVETGHVTDADAFMSDVMLREEEGPTGLGQGVAIPHGKSPAVAGTTIAIGRTRAPIEWPSLDEQPVSVIILFAVRDEDAGTTHLRLLQKVAILLASDDFIHELHAAATPDDVVALIASKTEEVDQ